MASTDMNHRSKRVMALVLSALLLGVLFPSSTRADEEQANAHSQHEFFEACVHPYPCGDEWPEDMFDDRFEMMTKVEHVHVASHDGALLEGWIARPQVDDGLRVPVLLHSTPYLGGCYSGGCDPTPADPKWWSDSPPTWAASGWGMKPLDLVQMGYAVAFFSVRGTGGSGGCFDLYGPDEASDQAFLSDYLASRDWSNGRVAMAGNSYPAGTAMEAAVADPKPDDAVDQVGADSLKTIIVSGMVSDLYTLGHSPQGLYEPIYTTNRATSVAAVTVTPPLSDNPTQERVAAYLGVAPERVCAGTAKVASHGSESLASDLRDEGFYTARRLSDRFREVTTSVLLAHGLSDFGHRFQGSFAWTGLEQAPKRQLLGAWGHDLPSKNFSRKSRGPYEFDPAWHANTWETILEQWLAFWLKGDGVHPGLNKVPEHLRLDVVDYQDTKTLEWSESTSWPGDEAWQEVLYLASGRIQASAGDSPESFLSVPHIGNSYKGASLEGSPYKPWDALCPVGSQRTVATSARYETGPLENGLTIAGQPFIYLDLRSTEPGGAIAAALADVGPAFSCDVAGQPKDVRWVTNGGADLRFHKGNMTGEDFPVDVPTPVRIDLADMATTVEPGHRLVLVLSFGEPHAEAWSQPYFPQLTVGAGEGGSHIVLPIVEGSLGGLPPEIDYPPRPFMP